MNTLPKWSIIMVVSFTIIGAVLGWVIASAIIGWLNIPIMAIVFQISGAVGCAIIFGKIGTAIYSVVVGFEVIRRLINGEWNK